MELRYSEKGGSFWIGPVPGQWPALEQRQYRWDLCPSGCLNHGCLNMLQMMVKSIFVFVPQFSQSFTLIAQSHYLTLLCGYLMMTYVVGERTSLIKYIHVNLQEEGR